MFSLARAFRVCHSSSSHVAVSRLGGLELSRLPRYSGSNHDVLIRGKKSKAKAARKEVVQEDGTEGVDIELLETDMMRVSEALKMSLSRLRAVGAHPEMLDGMYTHTPS